MIHVKQAAKCLATEEGSHEVVIHYYDCDYSCDDDWLEWPGIKTHLYGGTVKTGLGQSISEMVRNKGREMPDGIRYSGMNTLSGVPREEKAEKCEGQMRREHKELV